MNRYLLSALLFIVPAFSLLAQNTAPYWSLNGNSDATLSHKIGTTNNVSLRFVTNNIDRLKIHSSGNVGIGATAPAASALLEVKSTTQGVLLPRMTIAQRNAIASPAQGLIVFQTDGTKGFYYYDAGWKPLSSSSGTFANNTLSNLTAPTAINVDLLPGTNNLRRLGSPTQSWKNLYLSNAVYLRGGVFLHGSGNQNVFLGYDAGTSISGGGFNIGIGLSALSGITSGNYNTATGSYALSRNSTGTYNTATGYQALFSNTTGVQNAALGSEALTSNTTGNYNTAVGHGSLNKNESGGSNTAIGFLSLSNNYTGEGNTASGISALESNTIGENNTANGRLSLWSNIGGTNNTALGAYAIWTNESNYNNTAVGSMTAINGNNSTAIGYGATATASNQVRLGNSSVTSIGGQVGWTNFSDGRYKKDVKEEVPGLAFISRLRPVTYHLKVAEIENAVKAGMPQAKKSVNGVMQSLRKEPSAAEVQARQEKEKVLYSGFIAQEVDKAAQELGYDFSGVDKPKGEKDFYGLRYSEFVVPLVKAVQELSAKQVQLVEENEALKERLTKLEAMLTSNNNTPLSLSTARLEANAPNPFKGTTLIRYFVPGEASSARLLVTDMKGAVVKAAVLGKGNGQVSINSNAFAAGTYTYSLWVNGKQVETRQMVVSR